MFQVYSKGVVILSAVNYENKNEKNVKWWYNLVD